MFKETAYNSNLLNVQVSAAKITSTLRMLLNETIVHANRRKQFTKRLSEFEVIQFKLATSACHLFALESAVYMTAGRLRMIDLILTSV